MSIDPQQIAQRIIDTIARTQGDSSSSSDESFVVSERVIRDRKFKKPDSTKTKGKIKYLYRVGQKLYVGGWKSSAKDKLIKTLPSSFNFSAAIDNTGGDGWVVSLIYATGYSDRFNDLRITVYETIYSNGTSTSITLVAGDAGYFGTATYLPTYQGSPVAGSTIKGFGFYYAGLPGIENITGRSCPFQSNDGSQTTTYANTLQFVWNGALQTGTTNFNDSFPCIYPVLSTSTGTYVYASSNSYPGLPNYTLASSSSYQQTRYQGREPDPPIFSGLVYLTHKINQDGTKAIGWQATTSGTQMTWFTPSPVVSGVSLENFAFANYVYDVRDDAFSRLPTNSVTGVDNYLLGQPLPKKPFKMQVETFDTGFALQKTITVKVLPVQNNAAPTAVYPIGASYHP